MSGYGQDPAAPSASTVGRPRASSTPVLSIVSFVLSAIAVFFFPILFGTGAIVTAAIALSKRQRLAKIALAVAIVATIAGFALGALAVGAVLEQQA